MIKILINTMVLLILLLTGSCSRIDLNYIKAKRWNYESGFRVGEGDFMLFKDDQNIFSLQSDTIFYKGKPRAIIKKLQKEKFRLIITSIDRKESGEYFNIEEALQ